MTRTAFGRRHCPWLSGARGGQSVVSKVVRKNEMKIRDWMFNHIPAPGFMPGAFYFLLGFAGSVLFSVGFMCSGLLLDFLGGFLGFFGEFLLDIDGVAGDVFAALAEEEPDKHEDRTTEDK